MSKSFNNFTVIGNIGKNDAILKDGKNGKFVYFTLAAELGSTSDNTVWFICRIFRHIGKGLTSLTAGKRLAITGELSIDVSEGKTFYSINVGTFNWVGGSKYPEDNNFDEVAYQSGCFDEYDEETSPF